MNIKPGARERVKRPTSAPLIETVVQAVRKWKCREDRSRRCGDFDFE